MATDEDRNIEWTPEEEAMWQQLFDKIDRGVNGVGGARSPSAPQPVMPPPKDNINPVHYKVGGIETIEYMKAKSTVEEFRGHLRLTALKYLSRAGHKGNSTKQLWDEYGKAKWYIERLMRDIEERG